MKKLSDRLEQLENKILPARKMQHIVIYKIGEKPVIPENTPDLVICLPDNGRGTHPENAEGE